MRKIFLTMLGVAFGCAAFGQKIAMPDPVKKVSLNNDAPEVIVEEWITEKPDTRGKFVVWEFWGTHCNPCKKSIPHLNELSKKYKKEVVFIGIADEPAEKVRAMKEPKIEFYSAADSQRRTMKAIELGFVPFTMVVDPQGVVRWKGMPTDLTEEVLDDLIDKFGYGKNWEMRQADVTKFNLKSFLGKPAPELVVEEWLTEKPEMEGKFVLFEMYGTFCPPCWKAVPKLNAFHEQFKDEMVIIGVNNSKAKLPQEPKSHYYKGIDKERRTYNAIGLRFVPYALLVDPDGIVRWEGSPNDLDEVVIGKIIKKYGK